MNGVTNNTSIERERVLIIKGVRGIHQTLLISKAEKSLPWFVSLAMWLGITLPIAMVVWFLPSVSIVNKIGTTFVAKIGIILIMAGLVFAYETRPFYKLDGKRLKDLEMRKISGDLANDYIRTFSIPNELRDLRWSPSSLLTFAIRYDNITYTLSFDEEQHEVPMFSVPEGVLPEDQRTQRDIDVLFMHMRNRAADIYGLSVQDRILLSAEDSRELNA